MHNNKAPGMNILGENVLSKSRDNVVINDKEIESTGRKSLNILLLKYLQIFYLSFLNSAAFSVLFKLIISKALTRFTNFSLNSISFCLSVWA